MAGATTTIAVYADWDGLPDPLRLGLLHAQRTGRREVFEFEFDKAALAHPALVSLRLDARLGLFEGRQHTHKAPRRLASSQMRAQIAGGGCSCAAVWNAHNGQGR